MKWFRFYHEVLNDPKVQRLSASNFRRWINILCLASEQEKRGKLPALKHVAYALRTTEHKAKSVLDELEQAGLLEHDSGDGFSIHNWASRQPNSDVSRDRMRASRDRHGDALDTEIEREESTQSSEISTSSLPPERKDGAFRNRFVAVDKLHEQVAVAIEYFTSEERTLTKEQRNHLGGVIRKNGHGIELWRLIAAAPSATGDPIVFIEGGLRSGRLSTNRRSASYSGARVASAADIAAAEAYQRGET